MMIGGSSSGARPQAGIYDASGNFVRTVRRIVRVVGPASYAAGGFQVDCSAYFSSILCVLPGRVIITSTGASDSGQICIATEVGVNVYASAKFQGVPLVGANHTHTYDKANTPTGVEDANPSVGAATDHTHALTYTSTASGGTQPPLAQRTTGSNLADRTFEFVVEGVPL